MKRLCFILGIALLVSIGGYGQSTLFVDLIPDSLLSGSNAVVRYYKTIYERESLKEYSMEVRYAVTILNAHGKYKANLVIPYDRNSEITEIQGSIYNEFGLSLGKLKKKDIKDYPSNASYTLFSDNRVKTTSPTYNSYPYTVEYSYKIKYDAIVGFGNWMPVKWFNAATERAELLVKTPAELGIRYKAMNHPFEFEMDTSAHINTYRWSTLAIAAIESEPDLPIYLDYMPVVMLAPNDISYEGTTGSYKTWEAYGKWVYSLIKDRDILPEETVSRMRLLCDTISDEREKVKTVYQYMQGRTRYVNIALGIGGFQPLHAYEVDQKGYGDCKALSNYTRALLKSVGITSYYTEIGNGRSRELKYPDFASVNQTNHVILCVPLKQDTVWLECTSQDIPFGYIGAGNSNRYALLVSDMGGELARTPIYKTSSNTRVSNSSIRLNPNGNGHLELETDFTKTEFEEIDGLMQLSRQEQRDFLLEYLDLEGFDLDDFSIRETSSDHAAARISLNGKVLKYASKSGKRLFLRPEYLFSQTSFRNIPKDRELDLYIPIGYQHTDSISVSFPENYRVESLPEAQVIESDFGSYSLSITQSDLEIHVTRSLEIKCGTYGKSQFEALNSFRKSISGSDQSSIIICQH